MLLIKLAGTAGNAELCTAVLNIFWLESYQIASIKRILARSVYRLSLYVQTMQGSCSQHVKN